MKKIISIMLFWASAYIFSCSGFAQSANFLLISPDAQAMGMGGASIALDANAFALHNNPAAMALTEKTGAVAGSYGLWQPSVSKNNLLSLSGYGRIKNGVAFGAAARYFTYQPYEITSDQGGISGTFTPKEYDVEIGAAYKIWRFAIGATFKFVGSSIGGPKAGSAFAADVALMYKWKALSVSASVANLGTRLNYGGTSSYSLPEMIKLGVAYNVPFLERHRVSLALEGDYLFNGGIMAGIGAEYSFKEIGFLRAGYHYGDSTKAIPSYASIGLGGKCMGITLNGAYIMAFGKSPLKNTFSLSLGYEF